MAAATPLSRARSGAREDREPVIADRADRVDPRVEPTATDLDDSGEPHPLTESEALFGEAATATTDSGQPTPPRRSDGWSAAEGSPARSSRVA